MCGRSTVCVCEEWWWASPTDMGHEFVNRLVWFQVSQCLTRIQVRKLWGCLPAMIWSRVFPAEKWRDEQLKLKPEQKDCRSIGSSKSKLIVDIKNSKQHCVVTIEFQQVRPTLRAWLCRERLIAWNNVAVETGSMCQTMTVRNIFRYGREQWARTCIIHYHCQLARIVHKKNPNQVGSVHFGIFTTGNSACSYCLTHSFVGTNSSCWIPRRG